MQNHHIIVLGVDISNSIEFVVQNTDLALTNDEIAAKIVLDRKNIENIIILHPVLYVNDSICVFTFLKNHPRIAIGQDSDFLLFKLYNLLNSKPNSRSRPSEFHVE